MPDYKGAVPKRIEEQRAMIEALTGKPIDMGTLATERPKAGAALGRDPMQAPVVPEVAAPPSVQVPMAPPAYMTEEWLRQQGFPEEHIKIILGQ